MSQQIWEYINPFGFHICMNQIQLQPIQPSQWEQPGAGEVCVLSQSAHISALVSVQRVQRDKLMLTKCFHTTDLFGNAIQNEQFNYQAD